MKNYKQHIDDITIDFDNAMFKEYHAGQWGIEDGYKTDPLYLARLNYIIAKWQYDYDCTGELCKKSHGHISYTCCFTGTSLYQYTVQANCCSAPSVLNPADGLCYFPGSTTPFTTVPCLFCPTGYILNGITGLCQDSIGNTVNPATEGPHCVSVTGMAFVGVPNRQCPDLVPDSNVVVAAGAFGTSPFPQIQGHDHCRDNFRHHHFGDLL